MGYEYARLQIIAQGVRNAVQSSVTETCEDNYANIYNGVREGYSGGYQITKAGFWEETLDTGDVYARLDRRLKARDEGEDHVKYTGNTVEFRLSGLQAEITNAPFAPGTQNTRQMICTAEINLEVPLSFGWKSLPPMEQHLSVKSGYTPKF